MNDTIPQPSADEASRPATGWVYLEGLAVYLGFRLLDLGERVMGLLTAPFRWSGRLIQTGWLRLKPWLARQKRRLVWSLVALFLLTVLVGASVVLYLRRDESLALVGHLNELVGRAWRRSEPVVVVATAGAPPVPTPVPDGVGLP
jgi:hypothetical protein